MFEAFAIGPLLIWMRVLFLLVGIVVATGFFLRLAEVAHLSLQDFSARSWHYLGAFLLGGRLFAILAQYQVYLKNPFQVLIVWDGGFSFLGGCVGVAVILYLATRSQRATFLQWLDVLLPAATLGLTFDWLGKFFAGQAYGAPTDFPIAVTYDTLNVRYTVPVHPVQLYYTAFFAVLTVLLLIIRKHARRAGSETLFGIVLASVATMSLESLRGDFAIPVFATPIDFLVLVLMFGSLGVFAVIERSLSPKTNAVAQLVMLIGFGGYILVRTSIADPSIQLRFSQLLSVLALLAVVVYVVVHRRSYPHL